MSDDQSNFQEEIQEPPMMEEDPANQENVQPPPEQISATSQFAYLRRKDPVAFNPDQDLYLMMIDVDYQNDDEKVAQIRIFGNTIQGQSVCCIVKNFKPFFYLPMPYKMIPNEQNAQSFMQELNRIGKQSPDIRTQDSVIKLDFVHRNNIRCFNSQEESNKKPINFLKIYTKNPQLVNKFRRVFEDGITIDGERFPTQTFESNIPFLLRFLVEKQIAGMGWIKIKGKGYTIIPKDKMKSFCQVEVHCQESSVEAMSGQTRWDKLAPMRILSFDIECGAQRGFPKEERDPIITIGVVCKTLGDPTLQKIVLTLDSCMPLLTAKVVSENDERKVLENFQTIVQQFDPDFIIGYNMINFDFNYIMGRAEALKMKYFGYFGRMRYTRSVVKKERFMSKVMGMRESSEISIVGRNKLDMLIHMHSEHHLSSYTLNNVCRVFLNEEKDDVHHSQIWPLFMGTMGTRKRLAEYCLKDAELPLKLMDKLMCLYNYTEMARVTGVPINFLFKRGQQIKVISQLLRKIKTLDLVIPTQFSRGKAGQIGFQGAYVLNPKQGFYPQPVATLDFASLYPSIMMAHNLCYTTLLTPRDINRLGYKENVHYDRSPNGMLFAKSDVKKGILPSILNDLITARKKAKLELAKAVDEQLKAVLDGRQLALKISANSVYGFTGAMVGHLPCLEISATVTAIGRNLIDFTSKRVVELFPGCQVLYGDTDSVMVKFPIGDFEDGPKRDELVRAEAMEYGRKAAKMISDEINRPPIKLEFEKVYSPFLLMAKKRYAGNLYTKPEKPNKIDKKGFESVRRDNCPMIRYILEEVLLRIFKGQPIKDSLNFVKDQIKDLLMNKVDLSQLIITKSINRKIGQDRQQGNKEGKWKSKQQPKNEYKVKQAHVELAEKLMKRNPELKIEIGDRIPYIIIQGVKGSRNYENAEDPEKVLDEDLPIDFDYYIQKQIRPPLERLLVDTKIITNIQPLFCGEHTKNRYIPRMNQNMGGLGGYFKQTTKCIQCKVPCKNAICQGCQPKYIDIFLKKQELFQEKIKIYNKLWTHCQECQGSVISANFCNNTDCKIYFKRFKVSKEVKVMENDIRRLEEMPEW